jgi:hypothetical protein
MHPQVAMAKPPGELTRADALLAAAAEGMMAAQQMKGWMAPLEGVLAPIEWMMARAGDASSGCQAPLGYRFHTDSIVRFPPTPCDLAGVTCRRRPWLTGGWSPQAWTTQHLHLPTTTPDHARSVRVTVRATLGRLSALRVFRPKHMSYGNFCMGAQGA